MATIEIEEKDIQDEKIVLFELILILWKWKYFIITWASVSFKEGLQRFLAWTETPSIEGGDDYHKALTELSERGLISGGIRGQTCLNF